MAILHCINAHARRRRGGLWRGFSLLLACIFLVAPAAYAGRIGIAAIVNDDIITTRELEARRTLIMESAAIPDTPENLARITPRVLDGLITERLQLQEARRSSISVSEEEITDAIDQMPASAGLPKGALLAQLKARGLDTTLRDQARAQLSWVRVVQRKLRRNVVIAEEEISRQSAAQQASPGVSEARVISLLVAPSKGMSEEAFMRRVEGLHDALRSGGGLLSLMQRETGNGAQDVQFLPPVWVAEDGLPPAIQAGLRDVAVSQVSAPIAVPGGAQFFQVLDRRKTRPLPSATEVWFKQFRLTVPENVNEVMLTRLTSVERGLKENPGSCESAEVPPLPITPEVTFHRQKIGEIAPELRSTLTRIEVGELSELLVTPGSARFVMLCERSVPAGADAGASDEIRQQLFAEKMELEAQKLLRNLRRDATIDMRVGAE